MTTKFTKTKVLAGK